MFFGIIPIHPHHSEAEVMTIAWSRSANKNLALLDNIPDYLRVKLAEVGRKTYAELYEPITDQETSLQEALEEILALFSDGNQTVGHIRHVWMALILAVVVKPTIEHYQPNNFTLDETIEEMALWLLETIKAVISSKTPSVKLSTFKKPYIQPCISGAFSEKLAGFQILYEALDVYVNAIKTLNEDQSLEALIDILDDCLEGYAIFPGSDGRRDLLNWWLLDVVPSVWYLLPPSSMYELQGLPNSNKIVLNQMKTLKEISSLMWIFILEANKKNNQNLNALNKTELDIKSYNEFNFDRKLSASVKIESKQSILCI